MQLKHIIILQNKIDLIDEAKATNQHDSIQAFIQVSSNFPGILRSLHHGQLTLKMGCSAKPALDPPTAAMLCCMYLIRHPLLATCAGHNRRGRPRGAHLSAAQVQY